MTGARADEIRRESVANGSYVVFLRARDHLKKAIEAIQEIGLFLMEERERAATGKSSGIPDGASAEMLEIIDEVIDTAEETYDRIADDVGAVPRSPVRVITADVADMVGARPVKVVNDLLQHRHLTLTRQRTAK